MIDFIRKLNSLLRAVFLIGGAVLLFAGLKEKKTSKKTSNHGYQSAEFDDIW